MSLPPFITQSVTPGRLPVEYQHVTGTRSYGIPSGRCRSSSSRGRIILTLISTTKRRGERRAVVSAVSVQQGEEEQVQEEQQEQQQEPFTKERFEAFLLRMQESICTTAAEADGSGKAFCEDRWQRSEDPSSGYGITRVLEGGNLLEKAAANVSIVRGQLSEARAKAGVINDSYLFALFCSTFSQSENVLGGVCTKQAMTGRGRAVESGTNYFAGALSLVFHTRHPFVPTFRSDIRYFEVEGGGGWFGGGADLTPSYLFEEDAKFFHGYYKAVCDRYDPVLYEQSKAACDAYFYIPARREHRGIGGIFFDDLENFQQQEDSGLEACRSMVFSFVKDVAEGFMPSFLPIAERRRCMAYGEREREWQLLRRGRYLEFNLLYDRGVKFGLDGGRFESIMVSAPPLIAWRYNVVPELNSLEAELLEVLKTPRHWTSY
ncbi:hypothetical protein R1sor_015439 [Riccia sorocarpa]|uniref:Coproporphyrinogen oxidase n=1 Tax=Riccia sorocarpa TaxID=122646 RepID=A0ABD3HC88_9MARC